MPVYNDWTALDGLLPLLDDALCASGRTAHLLVCVQRRVHGGRHRMVSTPIPGTWIGATSCSCTTILDISAPFQVVLSYTRSRNPEHQRSSLWTATAKTRRLDVPKLLERCEAGGRPLIVFTERRRQSKMPDVQGFLSLSYRIAAPDGDRSARPGSELQRMRRTFVCINLWSLRLSLWRDAYANRSPLRLIPDIRTGRGWWTIEYQLRESRCAWIECMLSLQ